MDKQITLEKKSVSYTLRVSRRARTLRLTVASGGTVTVTAPPWMRQGAIERFLAEKSAWLFSKLAYFRQFPPRVCIKNRRRHFLEHTEKARALVLERLARFNRHYGFAWGAVTIRNQRSRWGSCSEKRNLNFSYKLALLPAHLADYVIVHELCHLKEQNHSAGFWALVAQTIPDHRARRKELRRIGMSLL